jgi:formate/nitrite transporter FocA (FNT family)
MVDTHQGRDMGTHFTIVAVVNLVFAIPAILFGAFVFLAGLIGGGAVGAAGDVPGLGGLIASFGFVIGLVLILLAVPGLVSAIGLFKREPWARLWTIVAGALSLLNVPIGTLFGIYALWVVTRPEADAELSDDPHVPA